MPYKDPASVISIEAARASRRKHYQANKKQYYLNNKIKKQKLQEYVNKLKDVPCLDCGNKFPAVVMDFDHTDGFIKDADISMLVNFGSWTKLKAEIAKCEIVCSNCHRIRTKDRRDHQCSKEASDTPNVAGGVRFSG